MGRYAILILFLALPCQADDRAKAALALARARHAQPTYEEQHARALATDTPLLVFVGIPAKHGVALVHEVESWEGVTRGVIVGVPRGAWLEWVTTLDADLPTGELWRRVQEARRPAVQAIRAAPMQTAPVFRPFFPAASFAPRFSGGGASC